MSLQPHSTIKGLWQSAGNAAVGTHALLIGVSEYPHLEYRPGEQRRGTKAADTGGMGQLAVSALTAARVFDWLRTAPSFAGLPIKSCRLHLSPRPSEEADVKRLAQDWYGDADLVTLRKATEDWGNALPNRAGGEARNIALFFYSGHGVEHAAEPALFASDILNPDIAKGSANALSFFALWQSVRTYGVSDAFFFIDACRNAPELAKRLNIVGSRILDTADEPGPAPESVNWLLATRLGDFAYQLAGAEATFYGQSLVEGLRSVQPDNRPYDPATSPLKLWFRNLEAYMKNRVRDLLTKQDKKVAQVLEAGGYPYNPDALVAELPSTGLEIDKGGVDPAWPGGGPVYPPGGAGIGPANIPTSPGDLGMGGYSPEIYRPGNLTGAEDGRRYASIPAAYPAVRRSRSSAGGLAASAFGSDFQPSLSAGQLTTARDGKSTTPEKAEIANSEIMHEIFKHENVTIPWTSSVKVLDAATGQPLSGWEFRLAHGSTRETPGRTQAFIDVAIAPGPGRAVWIQAGGGESPYHAVVVPRDLYGSMPLRLDVTLEGQKDKLYRITSLSARLGPPGLLTDSDERRLWQRIWEAQRAEIFAGLGSVTRVLQAGSFSSEHLDTFELALKEKMRSPVAAAIGAAYLLQAGAIDQLHDWPRNLSNWFPWLSEGPVLWTETLLMRDRNSRQAFSLAALNFFLEIARRGPPLIGPVFQLAARQLAMFSAAREKDPAAWSPDATNRFDVARAAIEEMATYMASGSLFTTFLSNDEKFSRERAIGTWARLRQNLDIRADLAPEPGASWWSRESKPLLTEEKAQPQQRPMLEG